MQRTNILSVTTARQLASQFWTNRHHGRGVSVAVDRDFARQAEELMLLTQVQRQAH
jgi:hypothetical protein